MSLDLFYELAQPAAGARSAPAPPCSARPTATPVPAIPACLTCDRSHQTLAQHPAPEVHTIMTVTTAPRRDNPVPGLVARARSGDQQAWEALVERYAPLVWSICRRHQLAAGDAQDVSQTVWLTLVDRLATIRDPAALPGWLATTTARECAKAQRAARPPAAGPVLEADNLPDTHTATAEEEIVRAERHAALREAFSSLPPRAQHLIALLIDDPPVPYAQISVTLGIPIGSIGPTRRRLLHKLRQHPAIAALINTEQGGPAGPTLPRRAA